MAYQNVKVYKESYNHVGIKPTTSPFKRKGLRKQKIIEVVEDLEQNGVQVKAIKEKVEEIKVYEEKKTTEEKKISKRVRKIDIRKYFDELYREHAGKSIKESKRYISNKMRAYFKTEEHLKRFIDENFERKKRNAIVRKIANSRKSNSRDFNYFCTFTYDSKKITEKEFRRKLKYCFWNLHKRQGWEYMGVWEKGERNGRWHFHGLFDVPKGTMPGEMRERNDYSFSERRRKITQENTYFAERFGRNDFKDVITEFDRKEAIAYITKYLEKSGEKIVCSKGVKAFFITDVLESDVLCEFGVDNRKMVLSPNMLCIDEGEIIGTISKETIKRLKKSN